MDGHSLACHFLACYNLFAEINTANTMKPDLLKGHEPISSQLLIKL